MREREGGRESRRERERAREGEGGQEREREGGRGRPGEEWVGASILVHGVDDTDIHVGADMNQVHLHWIPDEKEDTDDHDHDDVRDDVDDDDVPPYAIDGVL